MVWYIVGVNKRRIADETEEKKMYQAVNRHAFYDAFRQCRPGSFSDEGLNVLFEYLEAIEEDTGEKIELDVIALCCDFAEYTNLADFQNDYDAEEYPDMAAIEEATTVIPIEGSDKFIIQQF